MYCDLNAYEGDKFKTIKNETVEVFKKNIETETEAGKDSEPETETEPEKDTEADS